MSKQNFILLLTILIGLPITLCAPRTKISYSGRGFSPYQANALQIIEKVQINSRFIFFTPDGLKKIVKRKSLGYFKTSNLNKKIFNSLPGFHYDFIPIQNTKYWIARGELDAYDYHRPVNNPTDLVLFTEDSDYTKSFNSNKNSILLFLDEAKFFIFDRENNTISQIQLHTKEPATNTTVNHLDSLTRFFNTHKGFITIFYDNTFTNRAYYPIGSTIQINNNHSLATDGSRVVVITNGLKCSPLIEGIFYPEYIEHSKVFNGYLWFYHSDKFAENKLLRLPIHCP